MDEIVRNERVLFLGRQYENLTCLKSVKENPYVKANIFLATSTGF